MYESISQRASHVLLPPGAMQSTPVSNIVVQLRESRSANERHGRAIYLEVIALSSHRERVRNVRRVGEVPATIAVHYAVHVAHVRQLAGDLHARHAHTRHAKSAQDGLRSLVRTICT